MSAAERVAQAAQVAVTIGGEGSKLKFRIRQIDSRLILEAGGSFLLAAKPATPAVITPPEAPAQNVNIKHIQQGLQSLLAMVIAGTIAISADGGETWEECRIVATELEQDLSANKIHSTSLPPGTIKTLAQEILSVSMDGGAAATRLASFL